MTIDLVYALTLDGVLTEVELEEIVAALGPEKYAVQDFDGNVLAVVPSEADAEELILSFAEADYLDDSNAEPEYVERTISYLREHRGGGATYFLGLLTYADGMSFKKVPYLA